MANERLISQRTIERVHSENCFDFLRYFFAFSLILVHFCTLTETEQFWVIGGQTRVKAFFTITGFLVVYSFLRHNNLKTYARKRIMRIMPAYVIVILFCWSVCIFLTPLKPEAYFTQSQTWQYLAANLTMMNFLQPSLPEVFIDCYEPSVNGSLWSMKYEVLFYILIPFMIMLMRKYNKLTILLFIFGLHIIYHATFDYLEDNYPEKTIYSTLHHTSFNTMIYFFSGTALILYFDLFCRYINIILPFCIILLVFMHFDISYFYILNYIEPLVFSAVIIGMAYFCKPLNFMKHYDNISYGLYLYHYPIIQAIVQFGLHKYDIWLAFLLTISLTILFATISWCLIEKPILKWNEQYAK